MADLPAGLRGAHDDLWLAGIAVYAKAYASSDLASFTALVEEGKALKEKHIPDLTGLPSLPQPLSLVLEPDTPTAGPPPPLPSTPLPEAKRDIKIITNTPPPKRPGPTTPGSAMKTPKGGFFPLPPSSPPPKGATLNSPKVLGSPRRDNISALLSANLELKANISMLGRQESKRKEESESDAERDRGDDDDGGSDDEIGAETMDDETLDLFNRDRPMSITISSRPSSGIVFPPKPPPRRPDAKKESVKVSALAELEYLVRVYDETSGTLCEIWCMKAELFGGIKTRMQQGRSGVVFDKKSELVFSLANSEIFFQDDDTFANCLNFADLFKTTDEKDQPLELTLLPKAALGDKPSEKAPSGAIQYGGFLLKLGGKKWRKKFVCIRGRCLYYYLNQKAFVNKELPDGSISLGGCSVARIKEPKNKDTKRPFCFEVRGAHLGYRNLVLCAETEKGMHEWMGFISGFKTQRVKVVLVRVAEELEARNALVTPGLFRVSGDKHEVEQLVVRYSKGEIYDLSFVADEHAIAGLLKVFVREMSQPLLTHELYEEWLKIQVGRPEVAEQLVYVRSKIESLPASNRELLKYLMLFLFRVASHQQVNLMTPNNLAIVFAPNILRPLVPSNEKSVGDLRQMLYCVEFMIAQANILWPVGENNSMFKRQLML
jgi:hypothetical protein